MERPLTLVLVEGHAAIRAALAYRLQRQTSVRLLAAVADIPAALAVIAALCPDLVLFEPKTTARHAVSALAALLATGCPVVVWTSSLTVGEEMLLLRTGATAVLLKGVPLQALVHELRRAV